MNKSPRIIIMAALYCIASSAGANANTATLGTLGRDSTVVTSLTGIVTSGQLSSATTDAVAQARAYADGLIGTGTAFRAESAGTADAVTGAQAALIASSVQPSILSTAHVGYAASAGSATILLGDSAWITMSGTTGLLYRVTDNTNVIRVVSHSQDYNGPMGPFVHVGLSTWYEAGEPGEAGVNYSAETWTLGNAAWFGQLVAAFELPQTMEPTGAPLVLGTGTCILDWGLATNAYAIATLTDLANALAAYSPTGHGHAIADVTGLQDALDGKATTAVVTGIVDAAVGTLLDGKVSTNHVGDVVVTGNVSATSFIGDGSQLSGVSGGVAFPELTLYTTNGPTLIPFTKGYKYYNVVVTNSTDVSFDYSGVGDFTGIVLEYQIRLTLVNPLDAVTIPADGVAGIKYVGDIDISATQANTVQHLGMMMYSTNKVLLSHWFFDEP